MADIIRGEFISLEEQEKVFQPGLEDGASDPSRIQEDFANVLPMFTLHVAAILHRLNTSNPEDIAKRAQFFRMHMKGLNELAPRHINYRAAFRADPTFYLPELDVHPDELQYRHIAEELDDVEGGRVYQATIIQQRYFVDLLLELQTQTLLLYRESNYAADEEKGLSSEEYMQYLDSSTSVDMVLESLLPHIYASYCVAFALTRYLGNLSANKPENSPFLISGKETLYDSVDNSFINNVKTLLVSSMRAVLDQAIYPDDTVSYRDWFIQHPANNGMSSISVDFLDQFGVAGFQEQYVDYHHRQRGHMYPCIGEQEYNEPPY